LCAALTLSVISGLVFSNRAPSRYFHSASASNSLLGFIVAPFIPTSSCSISIKWQF
jgi:hypothetical protein